MNGTTFHFFAQDISAPALTDKSLQEMVGATAKRLNFSTKLMPSGAGHDAHCHLPSDIFTHVPAQRELMFMGLPLLSVPFALNIIVATAGRSNRYLDGRLVTRQPRRLI